MSVRGNKQFYRVTTEDLKSLGLARNPTILMFPIGQWVYSPTVKEGKCHDGGIWVAPTLSMAKKYKKYMMKQHSKNCRIFKATVGRILFKNSCRVKTDKVRCDEEIFV